ncbi:MAG TPA: acetate--CoA ligase family protein [Beijerinckiaceae bacterium]|jgi:acetyltransferase|nr:acetate--CoA ligase family protein [Beijerinckiaceae bacterium]
MNEYYERNRRRTNVEKVGALLNPRNVVIVGATDKPGNWPQRIWRNLHRYGYENAIYPFNPSRDRVWDTRCFRSFGELPEPPDHVLVLVPPAHVPGLLCDAAAAGARSATVITAGFGELPDPRNQAFARDLEAAIAETGLAVSGPNCLGNFDAAARFFSMPDDRKQTFVQGPVAIVAQSGGIVLAIKRTLEERGLDTTALITSGNETGLTAGDYIAYFATRPDVRVIACYLEAIRNPQRFLAGLRAARAAGKPVVVLKLGRSEQGRTAAAAHTGALAGSTEAFDAVAGAAGALRVKTTDDMVEAIEFLVHARPRGRRMAGITYSGGMRGLIVDAAAMSGLTFEPLSPTLKKKVQDVMVAGAVVDNPLDGAFATMGGLEPFLKCVEAYLDDPDIDLLLMQEELPRAAGTARQEKVLRAVEKIAADAGKPVVFIAIASYGVNDYGRSLRAELSHLTFLQEPDRALRTIAAATDYLSRLAAPIPAPPRPRPESGDLIQQYLRLESPILDETRSKRLLSIYGISGPHEELTQSEDEAVAAALRIGFPLALKVASAEIPHKSDVGGVVLGLASTEALRAAYRKIVSSIDALPSAPKIDGILVAEMISDGLELIIGVTQDHDMGPVMMLGAGGIDVERIKDVAFAAIPLDDTTAEALIERTRIGALIPAHRGRPGKDRKALVSALIGVSSLVADIGDHIESIDINPFVLREKGGVALDALIILRRRDTDSPAE